MESTVSASVSSPEGWVATKAPVEVLVIDHVEKPSAN
jgi:hypothetical protein